MNINNIKELNQLHRDLQIGIGKFKHRLARMSSIERYFLGCILNFGPVKTPIINDKFSNRIQLKSCQSSFLMIVSILTFIACFCNPLIALVGLVVFIMTTAYSVFRAIQQMHEDFNSQGLYFRVVDAVDQGVYTNSHIANVKKDGAIRYWPRGQGIFLESAFDVQDNLLKKITQ